MFHVWVGPSTPTVHLPCASSCTPGLSATSRVTTYSSSQSLRASMVVLLALIACLFLFPVSFTHRTLSNRRTAGGGGRDYNENNTSLLPEPPQQPTGNSQGDNVNRSDFERPSPDHSLLPEPPPPQARTTPRAPTPKTKKKKQSPTAYSRLPAGLENIAVHLVLQYTVFGLLPLLAVAQQVCSMARTLDWPRFIE